MMGDDDSIVSIIGDSFGIDDRFGRLFSNQFLLIRYDGAINFDESEIYGEYDNIDDCVYQKICYPQ